jgi:pyridinium-3,5-bisthiocarboxylic acid mononucleotide nickel chelatase
MTSRQRPTGRILHLDAFSGIAGNMFLGALLDLGLPRRELERELAGLGVAHALRVTAVRRGPLGARYVDVVVPGGASVRSSARKQPKARPSPVHSHPHPHAHDAGAHHHSKAPHGKGRSYEEIRRVLRRARLEPEVRARSLAIFEALAEAEARVHRTRLAAVHFHEVGAVDAIVDVTGAAIGIARLGVSYVTCSPVGLGHGTVETSHGRLPLPAPATIELLRGIPTVPAHVPWETVTPTGAAILRTIVDEFRSMPAMTPEAVGHGAGDDRPGPMPNVLRAILGREGGPSSDRVVSLETNLDDLVPEHFDDLMDRLFGAGALDVALLHQQMKKNRPGFLLRVLARPSERAGIAQLLFTHSSAIGVRAIECDRMVLPRQTRRVVTPYGRISVKIVRDGEGRVVPSAEYDDCKKAARRAGVPLREVMRAAEQAAREARAS